MNNSTRVERTSFIGKLHLSHFPLALLVAAGMLCVPAVQAQTYTVLHRFTGPDGYDPEAGVTLDRAGNLYGTTRDGGANFGTVYKLTYKNGSWVESVLYTFQGGADGAYPTARVVFGPDGALYGTTAGNTCCGTVFRLRPPLTICPTVSCPWRKTTLYRFTGFEGSVPGGGDLVFDGARNIYGTTERGGANNLGTVYELSPSNGGYTQQVLYNFSGPDGANPYGGVVFDGAGNLWGTTYTGGNWFPPENLGLGTLFELSPSGSGWTQTTLIKFTDTGAGPNLPLAAVTIDSAGNIFGTSTAGGGGSCSNSQYTGCGAVFNVHGTIYGFPGLSNRVGWGPIAPVTIDAAGNLYGTDGGDGNMYGPNVFKLSNVNGTWVYTPIIEFGPFASGPNSAVTMDSFGNLYGTGSDETVWEITP